MLGPLVAMIPHGMSAVLSDCCTLDVRLMLLSLRRWALTPNHGGDVVVGCSLAPTDDSASRGVLCLDRCHQTCCLP